MVLEYCLVDLYIAIAYGLASPSGVVGQQASDWKQLLDLDFWQSSCYWMRLPKMVFVKQPTLAAGLS